jgi:hypothetical protein
MSTIDHSWPAAVSMVIAMGGNGSSATNSTGRVATTGAPSRGAFTSNPQLPLHWPNQPLLRTLEKIEQIHSRMKPHPDPRSSDWLREARDGGLYGHAADN